MQKDKRSRVTVTAGNMAGEKPKKNALQAIAFFFGFLFVAVDTMCCIAATVLTLSCCKTEAQQHLRRSRQSQDLFCFAVMAQAQRSLGFITLV